MEQSIKDKELTRCPECQGQIHRIISRVNISTPKTNSELRDLGFTKLVRRDDGVYENVTRRDGDSRYMEKGKPETIPNINKTIQTKFARQLKEWPFPPGNSLWIHYISVWFFS